MNRQLSPYHQYLRNCQSGIPAEVVLGSPKYRDCRNFGVCKIHLEPSIQDCQCDNLVAAYLRLDPPTGRLLLHFLGCSISPDCRQRFFANRSFRIEDDFLLPAPVMDALNLGGHSFYLERGDYPLLEDDHFLTVSLRLGSAAALGVPQRMAA